MGRIFDNIEVKFTEGLQGIINNVGVKRVDFCVGYFNLRGWDLIVNQIDDLSGDYVYEGNGHLQFTMYNMTIYILSAWQIVK